MCHAIECADVDQWSVDVEKPGVPPMQHVFLAQLQRQPPSLGELASLKGVGSSLRLK
jgi:hypothetical protein